MASPSNVLVPLPTSSRSMRLRFVAQLSMLASSIISTMKVDCPLERSSKAPTRVNILSTRPIRASEAAVRILEAGVQVHPNHSQLRADYVRARLLAGLTDVYGSRKSMSDELENLQTLRRPSPLVWQEALSWLRTEAKLPAAQALKLEAALQTLIRPGLDAAALEGR